MNPIRPIPRIKIAHMTSTRENAASRRMELGGFPVQDAHIGRDWIDLQNQFHSHPVPQYYFATIRGSVGIKIDAIAERRKLRFLLRHLLDQTILRGRTNCNLDARINLSLKIVLVQDCLKKPGGEEIL